MMQPPRIGRLAVPYVAHPDETHEMAYYEWGVESAPPVVCVHGLARNARDFDVLATRLAQSFRVIAIDMPGRGKSEWLKHKDEYSLPCYMANAFHLLRHLGVDRMHWVGTSMGGMLGMLIASQPQPRITKLVMNDIGSSIPGAAVARIGMYVGKIVNFPSRSMAEQAYRQIYAPFGIRDEKLWRHLLDHSLEDLPGGTVRAAYDPAIGQAFSADPSQADLDFSPWWDAVQCPVLLIRGEVSDILLPETAQRMSQQKPDFTLHTVPGVGHAPTLTDERDVETIYRWLRRAIY